MRLRPNSPLATLLLLLFACATPSLPTQAGEDTASTAACEEPDADPCVVLVCDEGECGVFDCEAVDPEAMARAPLAYGAELARHRPAFRSPGFQRNWRRAGLRDGVRPRLTFHFRYRDGFLPAFPRLQGKLIKHHLFPQAQEFRDFFRDNGIDIHAWTMVIPEHAHLRIHRGAGRGGAWNEAWRRFMIANHRRKVPQEEMLGKAFELAFRFDIVGPIAPYGHTLVPEGPQLLVP
ncbi:TIGR02269 family lipoprotein [Archangium sp.]|jgi:uncharacterized lipoprotein (TIGR02269 family)|uniref:SitA6 family polymorphic toxin lipoprotein n=1 Tax=Archangium sp. TaxID=1872627 RepID=UPI002EDA207F